MTYVIKFLVAILAITALFGMWKLVNASLDKSEVVSCLEFVENAEKFQQFFITKSENEMCLRHGITIQTRVTK